MQIDVVFIVEVKVVRVAIARRSRPIEAAIADIVETAIVVVEITRSRIPDGRGTTELAGEVHTLASGVISVIEK